MEIIKKIIEKESVKWFPEYIKIDIDRHLQVIETIGKYYCNSFKIDKNNEDTINQMLLYFTGSEKCRYELNKGIFLVGGIGTGKTLLFKIFKIYTSSLLKKNSFQSYTTMDVVENVAISGLEYLKIFSDNLQGNRAVPIRCYIDDIASSNEKVNYYGTDINVIERLLSLRYNVYQKYGVLTHVSSNKYPKTLEDIYDSRMTDRFVEMFNVLELKGNSRRN
jgi:DNA replication protein DnaC